MSGVHGGLKESMKLPGNKKSKTYKVSQKIHNANLKTKQKKKKNLHHSLQMQNRFKI